MQIQTFSVVVGNSACNARCPFCVSKMTGQNIANTNLSTIDWDRFDVACRLAERAGCTTVMLTGKGEPTLWPDLIDLYIEKTENRFPIVELQTNGIAIADGTIGIYNIDTWLKTWSEKGLTTIAVSVVDIDSEKNRQIYLPNRDQYIDLVKLIDTIHNNYYSARLIFIMNKFGVHTPNDIKRVVEFAKDNKVEQITLVPVNKPQNSSSSKISSWVEKNHLTQDDIKEIYDFLNTEGAPIMELQHGAMIFDLYGQNVCLNNCLQRDKTKLDSMRNLIWMNNHLYHKWDYPGSIIL